MRGRLAPEQRLAIALAIDEVHAGVTSALRSLAQVIFSEADANSVFIGGRPLEPDRLLVRGQLCAGRTAEQKERLALRMTETLGMIADASRLRVSVDIIDISSGDGRSAAGSVTRPGSRSPAMDAPGASDDWIREAGSKSFLLP